MNPYGDGPGPYNPGPGVPGGAPLGPSGYGGPPYGGPQGDDQMAWIGIVCSSLGWFSCCCSPIPFVGIFAAGGGLLFSIAGTICGYLALQKAKQANGRTDLAMIGLVLGAVRLGLTALAIVAIVAMVVLGVGVGVLEGITHPR